MSKLDVEALSISYAPKLVNKLRVRTLKDGGIREGPVVYWMSRDQRINDNWALLYAQEVALKLKRPLWVAFCLVPTFLDATIRQYGFLIRGLVEVQKRLIEKNISFFLLTGEPSYQIPLFVKKHKVASLIADFDALKIKRQWKEKIKENIDIAFYEVDAHNIVPCWIASTKQEYGAYTLRPKLFKLLPDFLTEFPDIKYHPYGSIVANKTLDVDELFKTLNVDFSVPEIKWLKTGEETAKGVLDKFLREKLCEYHVYRNDPTKDFQSNLSPYLHFGQISAQRIVIETLKQKDPNNQSKNAFLEELIVRRELSDNFCFYNPNYDSIDCAPDWARQTIEKHATDIREVLYDIKTLEAGETYDKLWNACQNEMVLKGKMHGYMRMYWAKKIFEWTPKAEDALKIAIYLNDKYELDGRDPNGYTGIAWSICGVHDRAWGERQIFGKIRYMSYKGVEKKFDVYKYIDSITKKYL